MQDKNINTVIPSVQYEFKSNGKIKNEEKSGTWELADDNDIAVTIPSTSGEEVQYKGKVIPSWDFENKKPTLVFTAIDKNGIALWGKLIP